MSKLLATLCLLAVTLDAKSATTNFMKVSTGTASYWAELSSPPPPPATPTTSLRAYVDPIYGNDGTAEIGNIDAPYLTVTNAVLAANPIGGGGTNIAVLLSPSDYILGHTNIIRLSNNVSLIGYGRHVCRIYGSAPGSVGPLVVPGHNSIVAGLSIYQTNKLTAAMAFGTASDGPSTNVVVSDVYFHGGSDMIYCSESTECEWTFWNPSGFSDWDCVAVVSSGTVNHKIKLFSPDFVSDQRNAAWGPSGAPTHCILADTGTITVSGGNLRLYGTNTGLHAIARTRDTNATIIFAGGTFFDAVSTTPLIIRNDGNGTNIAQNAIERNQISGSVVWKTTNVVANSVTSSGVLTLNATNEVIVATGGGQGGILVSNALPRIKLQRTDGASAGWFRSLALGQFEIEIENTGLSMNWNTNGLTYIEMMSIGNMSTNIAFKVKSASANGPYDVMGLTTNGNLTLAGGTGTGSSIYTGKGFINEAAVLNTTAATTITTNAYAGRVRISAAQSYFVTNALVTANSIVVATVNTDDLTGLTAKAIPTAGLLELKLNAAATANTDISWMLVRP